MLVKLNLFFCGELEFVIFKTEFEGVYKIIGNKVVFLFDKNTKEFSFGDRGKRLEFSKEFSFGEEKYIFSNIKNRILENS
jgi:hypothetical protein